MGVPNRPNYIYGLMLTSPPLLMMSTLPKAALAKLAFIHFHAFVLQVQVEVEMVCATGI